MSRLLGALLSRKSSEKAAKTAMELWRPEVRILSVSYTEARLISTAQYENARVEVGVTIGLNENENSKEALIHGETFVREALLDRISRMEEDRKKGAVDDLRAALARKHRL